ncbi:hypothetical protein BPO_0328 [Bergeyella porcorum]|uniref:DUF5683 domain-containing protein n=1 Tax=Bergeyella porcorum TaxID=1735111 RepID=A0AAU0F105_9FLAO
MKKILSIIAFLVLNIVAAQATKSDSLQKTSSLSDRDTLQPLKSEGEILSDIEQTNAPSKILKYSPTKAGLYSAVLPGLGQYYNKKYWKIPIVWGAIGTGVGIVLWNEKQYNRYRNAFVAELNGLPHEFSDIFWVTADVLGRTQDRAKRQRDYAIAITGLIYVLGIVDAVVDAHLYEQRNDPDLALKPTVIYDEFSKQNTKAGLSLTLRF